MLEGLEGLEGLAVGRGRGGGAWLVGGDGAWLFVCEVVVGGASGGL